MMIRFLSLLVGLTSAGMMATVANASGTTPAQKLYVPLPDEDLLDDVFQKINGEAVSPVTTMISVAIATDDTIIYYDHWEDGYDDDLTQDSTEIWGDGNWRNGCAPLSSRGGVACTSDEDDVLKAGDVALLKNDVYCNDRNPSDIKWDGGDLLQSTYPVVMTRAAFPAGPGSMMAGAVEVFDESYWGTRFEAPVGEDLSHDTHAYEFVALAVMAGEDDTVVRLNGRNKGRLAQGGSIILNVDKSDRLTATKPVQVHMITGDIGSTYELRWYSLPPVDKWSTTAYAPVGDTLGEVKVTLYNPSRSTISVECEFTGGATQTISVPQKSTRQTSIIRDDVAAKFSSRSKFFAFSSTDTEGSGQIYDWGYPLMTGEMLTPQVVIGLGFGCTDNDCQGDGERSIVWVMPVEDADIWVDFDNDGNVDSEILGVDALEPITISDDTDEDMSGAVIWATVPGSTSSGTGVKLAAAWGQKAALSRSGDTQALDLGTVVVPFEPTYTSCSIAIVEDNDNNGVISTGDVVKETIEVLNVGNFAVGEDTFAVQTGGGVVNLEPMETRGDTRIYETTYTVPAGETVLGSCELIPFEPDAPEAPQPEPEPKATISGKVEEDEDDDDTGDSPLAGVTIKLKDSDNALVGTTTTDAAGAYLFTDLPLGVYTVEETDPEGYDSVSDTDGGNPNSIAVDVSAGGDSTGNDFVDEKDPVTISGTCYDDTDNDDEGEARMPGVTITCTSSATGAVVATTVTDANGDYSFTVRPGVYTVEETDPAGYISVSDTDGGNPNSIEVDVTNGSSSGNDFLDEKEPVKISGTVYEDNNGDTVGDVGLVGVTVSLLDDITKEVISSVVTDEDGNYEFTKPPGVYQVRETDPHGYMSVADIDGDNDNHIVVDCTNGDSTGNDFVDALAPVTISGTVMEDEDGDTTGDKSIPEIEITLKDSTGTIVGSTTTDANGDYEFSVPPGVYEVVESDGPGFTSVTSNNIDVDVTNGDSTGNDFVDEMHVVKISGTVYEDNTGDDVGDIMLSGVTVTLLEMDGTTTVETTATDSSGNYEFIVPPGEYLVRETDLHGYMSVSDTDGGNPNRISVDVSAGEDSTGNDFVDRLAPATISGTVLEDEDGDTTGDKSIPEIEITLKDSTGEVVGSTTTDANGEYEFSVPPGVYEVVESDGPGFTSVTPNMIDVDVTNGDSTGNDFVDEKVYVKISGTVYEDLTNNDSGDIELAGVTIKLLDTTSETTFATTTTGADGSYEFTVQPGEYLVRETDLTGYMSVSDTYGDNDNRIIVDATTGDSTGNDFVDEKADATISGTVLEDVTGDSNGDQAIPEIEITLKGSTGKVVGSTTTDEDGDYQFSVRPGVYEVVESDGPGFTSVTPNMIDVDVTSGGDSTGNDFVDEKFYVKISGTVYEDLTNNDVGDIRLAGVTIKLLDTTGETTLETTTTAADGTYEFTVQPGEYLVRETDLTGYMSVSDTSADGVNDNRILVDATTSDSTGNDFVDERADAKISGTVLEDKTGNDIGDEAIPDIEITLKDETGEVVGSTDTDANGDYEFSVRPGKYQVVETDGPGFSSVTPNSIDVDVTSGGDSSGNDFVDEQVEATISGTVLEDSDNDNLGDKPLSGVEIILKTSTGTPVATTKTDANGDYEFSVVPGVYDVIEMDPVDFVSVSDADGGNDNTIRVDVSSGGASTGNDFVDEQLEATISGTVLSDTDDDGEGDTPLPNVEITLTYPSGIPISKTTTGPNGDYKFTVPPGVYEVVETNPPDYIDVSDTDGPNDNTIEVDVSSPGSDSTGNVFVDKPEPVQPPAPDERSPEDEASDKAYTRGDPHFKTFGGEMYDYHGECDLVLLHNPDFKDGLGMDIHIRTKIEAFWSSVESAVLKLGDETLEIKGDPESNEWLWFNGKEVTSTQKEGAWSRLEIAGFLVRYKQSTPNTREVNLYLKGVKEVLMMKTFKSFVRVDINWQHSENYYNSIGLLGSHAHDGQRLGRDGKTFIKNVNAFGQEWQVIPEVDGSLFHSYEGAVVGKKCVMPPTYHEGDLASLASLRGRRLGASALDEEAAEKACNHLVDPEEKKACVFDVVATQDLNMASTW